jgi:hypothetical protein
MTQQCEEMLLSDVGEMKGMLARALKGYDEIIPTLASHDEVKGAVAPVADSLKEHKRGHVTRKTMVAAWVSSIVVFVTGTGAIIASLVK